MFIPIDNFIQCCIIFNRGFEKMIYSSFNPKVWNTLLYSMVISGLKEKDYSFFTSDFYKNFIENYLNEETKLKVKDFVIQFEREHEETIKQSIECAKKFDR